MTDNNPDVRKPLILIAEDVESNYKLLEIILKKEYDLYGPRMAGRLSILPWSTSPTQY